MGVFVKFLRRVLFTNSLFSDVQVNACFVGTLNVLFMVHPMLFCFFFRLTSLPFMSGATGRTIFVRGGSGSDGYSSDSGVLTSTCGFPSAS